MLFTINKIRSKSTLLFVFLFSPVMAQMILPEIKENPIYTGDYLALKNNEDLLEIDYKTINVKVYENSNLSGAPYLEFNKEGVKTKGTLTCKWFKDRENVIMEGLSIQKTAKPERCSDIFPLIVRIDARNNLWKVWFIANSKETPAYYSAKQNNKEYFIDKNSLSGFEFKKAIESVTKATYKKNYEELEKLFKKDPAFKEAFFRSKQCIEKKDRKCLKVSDTSWNAGMESWAGYLCLNFPEKEKSKVAGLCSDVESYRCAFAGGSLEEHDCDIGMNQVKLNANGNQIPNPDAKLIIKDKKQAKIAEDMFWEEIKTCFIYEPGKARFPIEDSGKYRTKIDENYRARCTMGHLYNKPDQWEFINVSFRQDYWPGVYSTLIIASPDYSK